MCLSLLSANPVSESISHSHIPTIIQAQYVNRPTQQYGGSNKDLNFDSGCYEKIYLKSVTFHPTNEENKM